MIPSARPGYAWRNAADAFTVHFAPRANSQNMVLVTDATSSLSFGFEGADPNSTAVVDGSKVTYPNVRPGIDLVYEVRNGEVKELIVLRQAPSDPPTFAFPLALDNLSAQDAGSGALNLVTGVGDLGFRISDLWMVDSARGLESGEVAFSESLTSTLAGPAATPTLTVTPDHGWLSAPERVYPVTIDPTITKTTNDDTYVQSNICCTDVSGENEMKSGTYDSGSTKARSLMKFADVHTQVPNGATITGAKLYVWESHSWSCNATNVSVHRITDPWDGNSVRWSNQPGVATAATTVNVAKGYSASCSAGWVEFPTLGTMVEYWKNNNNNYGIEIRSPNETNNDYWKKWHTIGTGHASYLDVTYTDPPDTTPPGAPVISSSTHPSENTYYGSDDPSFSWTQPSDPSGIEGYSYVLDTSSSTKPDNILDTTARNISYSNLAVEGDRWFHVRAKDGAGNWSTEWDDYRIRIDSSTPGAPSLSSSSHPDQSACSTNNDPSFSWSASDNLSGVVGYSYILDQSSGTTPDTTSEGTGTTKSYSDVSDAEHYLHVRAQDAAGNWGSASHYKVRVNATGPSPPVVSSSTHSSEATWYQSDDPAFGWSLSDFFGLSGYSYVLDQSSGTTPDQSSEGTGTGATYFDLVDGEHWFHVRAQDGCSLWGQTSHRKVRIDDTAPASPVISSSSHPSQSDWNQSNDPAFSWSASDTSGISGYSYVLDGSASTNPDAISEGSASSKSYVDVADGEQWFHVRAENGSGLWGTTSHYKIRVDTTAPPAPGVSSSTHPDQNLTYRSNDPVFSWTTSDTSGISGFSYSLNQLSSTTPDTTSEGTDTTKAYGDLADGTWWFHVRAKDGAGNWGNTTHFKVTIDVPAPSVTPTIIAPSGQVDPTGEGTVKDGDLVTINGTITEGNGGPLDPAAIVSSCEYVLLNEEGVVELARTPLSSSQCGNSGGSLQGSFTVSSSATQAGLLQLEVVVQRETETSPTGVSNALLVDNLEPLVGTATRVCDAADYCDGSRSLMVTLTEPVVGSFVGADFVVEGNVVLLATSTCSETTFCDEVSLTLLKAIGKAESPRVTYAFAEDESGRVRPRDGAHNVLPDVTMPVADGERDSLPGLQPVAVTPHGLPPLEARRVCSDGFTPDGLDLCVIEPAQPSHYAVTGRVIDEATGEPISGATVTITRMLLGELKLTATTDALGQFAFANLPIRAIPRDRADYVVTAPGYGTLRSLTHFYMPGEGYGLSLELGQQDRIERMQLNQLDPEGTRGSGSQSLGAPAGEVADSAANQKFDHRRVPAVATVDVYDTCEKDQGTLLKDDRRYRWLFYVLHVLGPEVGSQFDEHSLTREEGIEYVRANASAISNYAWAIKLYEGNRTLDSRTNDQCFIPGYDTAAWWPDAAKAALRHRVTDDEGNIRLTQYKAGSHQACDPPYQPGSVYELDQHDSAQCAAEGMTWREIINAYYGPNGWEIRDASVPLFRSKTAEPGGTGEVKLNWNGVGIWRSIVYRQFSDGIEPPHYIKLATLGWKKSCRCIDTSYTDTGRESGQDYVYKIDIFNPKGSRTGFVTGEAG